MNNLFFGQCENCGIGFVATSDHRFQKSETNFKCPNCGSISENITEDYLEIEGSVEPSAVTYNGGLGN